MEQQQLIPTISSEEEFWSLKTIERATMLFSLLALMGVLYLHPTPPMILGIVSGALIGFFNFRLLRRFVQKLLIQSPTSKLAKKGIVFFIKMILLIGLVAFLILGAQVNPIAFIIGFSCVVLAIFYEGLRVIF